MLFPDGDFAIRASSRLDKPIAALLKSYGATFRGAAMVIGFTEVAGKPGASGFWLRLPDPAEPRVFVIEVALGATNDATFESLVAHELAHPIIRLQGIPTGISIPPIDCRIGDEFTSTSHHPYVFHLMREWGYADDDAAVFNRAATDELAKLASAELSATTYTAPTGQTWLSLWYFNLLLMAPDNYRRIAAFHAGKTPVIVEKMHAVEEAWKHAKAKCPYGFIKRTRVFQERLMVALDLNGRVRLQDAAEWQRWLFP